MKGGEEVPRLRKYSDVRRCVLYFLIWVCDPSYLKSVASLLSFDEC